MIKTKSIIQKLKKATKNSVCELYTDDEILEFAKFYKDDWDKQTSNDIIADSFVEYMYDKKECRRCTSCGKLMKEGYCVDSGVAYYCCDDCLHTEFSDEEWQNEHENNDQSYYTEWE